MTTTHPIGTSSTTERAAAFAAQVRASLSYLAPEELDDLLDGLGADLEERLAEGGELGGDPAQYAEELRQAAGLPARSTAAPTAAASEPRPSFGEQLASTREAIAAWFAETPARSGVRDFVVALRPVWWIVRAGVLAIVLLALLSYPVVSGRFFAFPAFAIFTGLAIVSVQWGRGKWLPRTWLKRLRTVLNVIAVMLLVPVLSSVFGFAAYAIGPQAYSPYVNELPQGLTSNGRQIENIFAYDCQGNLIPAVRLYDQHGAAIGTGAWGSDLPEGYFDHERGRDIAYSTNAIAGPTGQSYVFPLTISAIDNHTGQPGPAEAATPRHETIPPLSLNCQAKTAGAGSGGASSEESGSGETPTPTP